MIRFFLAISFFIFSSLTTWCVDSFLPYQSAEEVPKTAKELWAAYDSTKEDLDVKVIKEWKEDGIIIRYLTYKVGTFKGTDARVAAYYSFLTSPANILPLYGLMEVDSGQNGHGASTSPPKDMR